MLQNFSIYNKALSSLPDVLINTINAHSYNTARKDKEFANALLMGDVLLPDGVSIVWAMRWLIGVKLKKIAGADLFYYEMERMNSVETPSLSTALFLGSSEDVLAK